METEIQLTLDPPRAVLQLAAPSGRPPVLDRRVLESLERHLTTLEQAGESVRLVILRSGSPKYFCLGADINAVRQLDVASIDSWIDCGHRVFNRLECLPMLVVARIAGYAIGGGVELALAADLILAEPDAQFAQTEVRLGLVPGWGGTGRLLERIGPARVKEMLLTGRMVPAAEAASMGLVDLCASAEALDARCDQWRQDLSASSPVAVRELKKLLWGLATVSRETIRAAEAAASLECLRSADIPARLGAFLARRRQPASTSAAL